MISELETLEEVIEDQARTIQYLSNHIDRLTTNKDKVYGLIREYDCGNTTATMLISYLKVYIKE